MHLGTQGAPGGTGASETPTARPTALDVNVATRTTKGTGGWTKAREMDTINMDQGVEGPVAKKGPEAGLDISGWCEKGYRTCLLAESPMAQATVPFRAEWT